MQEVSEANLATTHHFAGGVYAKEVRFKATQVLVSHKHVYDHLSVLASGRALVTVAGVSCTLEGPEVVTIKAGMNHRVEAITDCVWLCIHSTSETDPKVVDNTLIVPSTPEELRAALEGGP